MKFYITTPIYYVNDKPHIGHAYTTLAADVLVRYHRFLGNDIFFLAGTDEHGAKIEEAAAKTNLDPQKFCDEKTLMYKNAWQNLNISYDNFIRTTDENHIKAVENCLRYLHDNNFLEKGNYEGLYCASCEQYKTESDLIDGKCPDHKIEPILMKEQTYFFKMSQFQNELKEKIEKNELIIEPEPRKKEILSFLKKQKLEDISMSREKVKWGIPLPFDKSQTCYVWIDAFLNYLTGLNWKGPLKKPSENFQKYWPPAIQLIGKDILRVHATIWPSLLLAMKIPLPKRIVAHGFFTINGQKMSKSLGNVIWPEDLISKYGVDATRYLLLTLVPFGNDGDISLKQIEEKYNADLVNGIGNVVSRFIGIISKNPNINNLEINLDKIKKWGAIKTDVFAFPLMAKSFTAAIDQRINDEKLWQETEQKKEHLIYIAEHLLLITLYLKSFMPETSDKILDCLGLSEFKNKTWPEIEKEIEKNPKRTITIKPLEKQLFPRLVN